MSERIKSDTQLVGAAGEHLVLSRLLARGVLAAQAPRGTRKADILVNHLDGKAPCLIQVKTRSGKSADGGWHMKAKHEDIKELTFALSPENLRAKFKFDLQVYR